MIPALLLWVAMGQQPCPKGYEPYFDSWQQMNGCRVALKCGKWEHVDTSVRDLCGTMQPENQRKEPVCNTYPQVVCAPDLHTITEKEWQETQEAVRGWRAFRKRLDILNDKLQAGSKEGRGK